jgi:hypothetical protein
LWCDFEEAEVDEKRAGFSKLLFGIVFAEFV